MGKRRRTLLMSAMSIMLSVAMLVAGTYALFSDRVTIENHLVAGTLQVTLVRTKLEQRKLDSNGVVRSMAVDETRENFTNTTTDEKNIFGIGKNEVIAPSSSYKATMLITNGGNVAFDYSVKIKLGTSEGKLSDEALCKQVKVVVTNGTTEYSKYLSECDQEMTVFTGRVYAGGNQDEFSIKLVFENRTDNNSAQTTTAWFDLVVDATQAVD